MTPRSCRSCPSSAAGSASARRCAARQPVLAKPQQRQRQQQRSGSRRQRQAQQPAPSASSSPGSCAAGHSAGCCSCSAMPASQASAAAARRKPVSRSRPGLIAASVGCRTPRKPWREHHVHPSPTRCPGHHAAPAGRAGRRLRALRAQRQPGVHLRPHRAQGRQALGRPAGPDDDHRRRQGRGARHRHRPAGHAAGRRRRAGQGGAHRQGAEPGEQHAHLHRTPPGDQRLLRAAGARSSAPRSARMRAAPSAWRSCRWAPASRSN